MKRLENGVILSENGKQFWKGSKIPYDYTDTIVILAPKYNMQPDLLAYEFYGNTVYEWLILYYNNITDPWTQFVTGKTIRLPKLERVQ